MKTKILKTIAKYFLWSIFLFFAFAKLNAQNLSSDYVAGEIIVQLNPDVSPNQLTQSLTQLGLSQQQKISDILNTWLFQYSQSPIKFINCIDAKMAAPPDTTETPPDTIINLSSTCKQLTNNNTSTYLESSYLRQTFNVFPNPSTGNITITFSLVKASNVTIQVTNNTGKKVLDVVNNQFYEMGKHSIDFGNKESLPGIYFYTIITNEGINALKLVISR
ncbi:MAG: hypothetical protein COX07_01045 [Bacteroidetes bacterium CG23_combo_of_CG06-09_8_20_14_all_32_9]|nr:MAG: hypothetical protein COX07_01045 [Bacteroidetes bacterium CG23_combo_of_CG06-09_8_20_14_all_32_9]